MSYVAVTAYYKHAEVDFKIIKDDDHMREFCEDELERYGVVNNNTPTYSIKRLIRYTAKKGREQIDKQLGSGLIFVFQGTDIRLVASE